MKTRTGFVSNSSSSSFVCLSLYTYKEDEKLPGRPAVGTDIMDIIPDETGTDCVSSQLPIDELISKLLAAKAAGSTHAVISVTADAEYDS